MQVAAWQQELVADYGGAAASEVDGSAGGVPNWGLGDSGGVRPQAPSHLTRWGVSSEQDAEWQALLTAQQVRKQCANNAHTHSQCKHCKRGGNALKLDLMTMIEVQWLRGASSIML